MSRLRRTGSGDLLRPHLGPVGPLQTLDVALQLIPPGTSSHGTALFSTLLGQTVANPAHSEGVDPKPRTQLACYLLDILQVMSNNRTLQCWR